MATPPGNPPKAKTITLAWLEEFIRRGKIKFSPELEAAFHEDRKRYLAIVVNGVVVRTTIGFNLCLVLDYYMLRKSLWLSAAIHLGIITPYFIIAGQLLKTKSGMPLRNILFSVFPILMAALIMLICGLNPGPGANELQFMVAAIIVYTNFSLPLDLRFALLATSITTLIYLGALLTGPFPSVVKVTSTVLITAVNYMSIEAKIRLERASRFMFLRRLQNQLQRDEAENAASRDALSGLSNRRHLVERARELWSQTRDSPEPTAIIMIDIDHFKLFNDMYGHPAGDHCIKRVASAISAVLRGQDDLAVRYGGEEFLLMLPHTRLETAIQIAERTRRAIEIMAIPHTSSPTSPVVTASIGAAAGPTTIDLDSLIAAADKALYLAKRNGRNQVRPPFMTLETGTPKSIRSAN